MIKKISLLSMIFLTLNIYAQKELKNGFVVLETNDTIFGMLKDKNYYSKTRVKLYQGDKKITFSKKKLSEIHIENDLYIKSDIDIWFKRFFKKEVSGNVNLYTYKKTKKIGNYDADISQGRLIPSIKFHCSDYPFLKDSIKNINKENVSNFITTYNNWKSENTESKSIFENKIHHKPIVNFKMSFLLPGAGFDFGLSNKISVSTILKNEFGYIGSSGWIMNPFIDMQLRYYLDIDKRIAENKRTYKYSGNYIAFINAFFPITNSNLIGFEYGWQRIISKHWYYNIGVGAGKWTSGNQNFTIIYDFDFGYNF
jgi:hypothetical protein